MRRAGGFTIVELLVSMALGGFLIAGAFQLHVTFSRQTGRQQRVADLQQGLRVSRQVLERAIRAAGAGLEGGRVNLNACNGAKTYYAIEYSNSNAYVDQRVAFDTTANGDPDVDPDWIRILSADPDPSLGGTAQTETSIVVNDVSRFLAGDRFIVVSSNPSVTARLNCLLSVTSTDGAGGAYCGACGGLQHAVDGLCINLGAGLDPCLQAPNVTYPATVRKMQGAAVFRVEPQKQLWCPSPPCLGASFAAVGQAPSWQIVAEGVEDLQVGLVMSDGRVCGDAVYSVDSPILCPPQQVKAVRYTLTVRSSSEEAGGLPQRTLAAAMDRPASLFADGYLRRVVTTEVELRNQ